MTLANNGLTKLSEECGELIQIAQKKIAFPHTDDHPDKKGSLKQRLQEEIADVLAACSIVIDINKLDTTTISNRVKTKYELFDTWHKDINS